MVKVQNLNICNKSLQKTFYRQKIQKNEIRDIISKAQIKDQQFKIRLNAIILIQSAFRGIKARRDLIELKHKNKSCQKIINFLRGLVLLKNKNKQILLKAR